MYSVKRKYHATKGVPAHRWCNFTCLPRRGQLKNWTVGHGIPMQYGRNRIYCSITDCVTHIHANAQAVSCLCLVASTSGTPRDRSRFRYVPHWTISTEIRAHRLVFGTSSPTFRLSYRTPSPNLQDFAQVSNVRATTTDLSHIRTRPPPATLCIIFVSLIIMSAQRKYIVVT